VKGDIKWSKKSIIHRRKRNDIQRIRVSQNPLLIIIESDIKRSQNQLLNASRRTATYTKDKTVIVTEEVNVVDFNSDNFVYLFGNDGIR